MFGDLSHLSEQFISFFPSDDCIFYATQEASIHFFDVGFNEEELESFRDKKRQSDKEISKKYGDKQIPGIGFVESLRFIKSYIHPKFIDIETVWLEDRAAKEVKKLFLEKENFSVKKASQQKTIKPPLIAYAESQSEQFAHVFFAESKKDFKEKMKVHITGDYALCAIIELEKAPDKIS